MNRQHYTGLKLSSLTMALTCILYLPASSASETVQNSKAPNAPSIQGSISAAQQELASAHTSLSLHNADKEGALRVFHSLAFTNNAYKLMVNNITSQKYIENKYLSASATFPLRLFRKLNQNPWQPAPIMAVPEKDLACYYGIPSYRQPLNFDPETTPIQVSADNVTGSMDSTIVYEGNVSITQGDKLVKADTISYDMKSSQVLTEGNLTLQSPEVTVTSRKNIESNLQSKISTINEPFFQLNGSVARGQSSQITINHGTNSASLKNTSFTTCPIGDNSWYFSSESINVQQNEDFGEAYHNVLYMKDVPVFYIPYVNFPISHKRKSGLLYPEFALSSDNGFEYSQPIYFNLAPNYDYTLTPRFMTKRGVLLSNEFRYMPFANTQGTITFDYMPQDNNWMQANSFDSTERYMFRLQQTSSFLKDDLVFKIDYQAVRKGDYDYLNDIGIDEAETTDDHLLQSFIATYDQPDWNVNLELRDYQRLLPDSAAKSRLFAVLPQINGTWYKTYGKSTFNLYGEATHFSSDAEGGTGSFETTRFHFEPDISYQLFNSRGTTATATTRGFFTYYNQDSLNRMPEYFVHNMGFTSLEHHKSRALYLLQLNAKTTLERRILDLSHTQTLEPEIQYQYIPYHDQNDIALYDTTDRISDYYSNFSFRKFTGNDRIPDLNNLTVGLTSRILDAHDREQLRFGIAQTYSFVPTRVTLHPNDPQKHYPRSPLSVYFNAHPLPNMTTHASFSYSTENNNISSWSAMAEYRNENGFLTQVSYRFIDHGNKNFDDSITDLSQLGLIARVPLGQQFSLTAATYRDLQDSSNIDTRVSLRYEECCWSVAFVYENYNKTNWNSWTQEEDHMFGIEFEFKGVGSMKISGQTGKKDDTDTYLLDYFNPTNLNH